MTAVYIHKCTEILNKNSKGVYIIMHDIVHVIIIQKKTTLDSTGGIALQYHTLTKHDGILCKTMRRWQVNVMWMEKKLLLGGQILSGGAFGEHAASNRLAAVHTDTYPRLRDKINTLYI